MLPDNIRPRRPLPADTRRALQTQIDACPNLGLLLDKYQPWDLLADKNYPEMDKGQWLALLAQKTPSIWKSNPQGFSVLRDWRQRWLILIQRCGAPETFPMVAASRVVIGLGAQTTLETAITLHSLYGLPYIPGSAQKGLARSAAIYNLAEQWGIAGLSNAELGQKKETPLGELDRLLEAPEDDLETQLQRLAVVAAAYKMGSGRLPQDSLALRHFPLFQAARAIFGWMGHTGEVVFYDALPVEPPRLVVEIMNPHFPEYYQTQGDTPPGDNQNPIPVLYLAVDNGSTFRFAVGARRPSLQPDLKQARDWLFTGLTDYGIGGKTSSGMGFFGDPQVQAVNEKGQFVPFTSTYTSPAHRKGVDQEEARPGMGQALRDLWARQEEDEEDE